MDENGFLAAILPRRHAIGDGAHPIVEQGRVDEARPDVQGFGEIPVRPRKPQVS